jgi:hypothetical protein
MSPMAFFCLCLFGRINFKKAMDSDRSLFYFEEAKMIRQEIVICPKCGALKELSEDCECTDEKKSVEAQD